MKKINNLRNILMMFAGTAALAGCFGADRVASPGEGVLIGGIGSSSSSSSTSSVATVPTSCPTGLLNAGLIAGLRNCQLPNLITGTLTLDKVTGVIYSLNGRTQVGDDAGPSAGSVAGALKGVLNIAPGVTIFGSAGADFLIVSRGSQIFASGTKAEPIIMTSREDIEGTDGVDTIGKWGGLVLAGRAPTNVCPSGVTPPSDGCSLGQVEGTNAAYGGNLPADNSGTIKFLQLKYSGFEVQPSRELNGITFAGIGSGTTVENVQVHNSSDDGIEMFGGTVNLKNVILTGNDDDSFDTDNGYVGSVQFLIVRQRANGGDHIFEMSCAGNAALCSHPKISNATLIGRSSASNVVTANSGTDLSLVNSVLTKAGGTGACISILGANTQAAAPFFRSVHMSCGNPFNTAAAASPVTTGTIGAAATEALFDIGGGNTKTGVSTLSGVTNGTNEAAVVSVTGAPLTAISASFANVSYIGAVKDGADTWYAGWSCGIAAGSTC